MVTKKLIIKINGVQIENKNQIKNDCDILITDLIQMHVNLMYSLDDMKNIVMIKNESCDLKLGEINEAKHYYVDENALHDVTRTHDSRYNIDTSTTTLRPPLQRL